MKVSYNTLKSYYPNIKSPETVAEDLIMHTAEVESVEHEGAALEHIVYGIISSIENHPDADSLRVCKVDIGEAEPVQIVCGGSNLQVGQAVAVAKIGAVVSWHGTETITMKKTAIRGVDSYGMICASEEIGLIDEFPQKTETEIMDLSHIEAKTGTPLAEVLGKNDTILEIDNKAINHRPDLFSHIGIAREIAAIDGQALDFEFSSTDFSELPAFPLTNTIPHLVRRYIALHLTNLANTQSPEYIQSVIASAGVASKGILVDISNYSLYLLGQPMHCFDAEKISGSIIIRMAKKGESFTALDDKNYELTENDIVIADEEKILALAGVIGAKSSAVSDTTKQIVIESAHFDQAVLRKTGKRLGLRTDALNVFEKDIVPALPPYALSFITKTLQDIFPALSLLAYTDDYHETEEQVVIDYDPVFFTKLLGKNYEETEMLTILQKLGLRFDGQKLLVPFWRKDLRYKADIAEEIARIEGYNNIASTIADIASGAVSQSAIYTLKRQTRSLLTSLGFYDLYTYSFVDDELQAQCLSDTSQLVAMKNPLTEEMTHLRGSLIPHLLSALEKNTGTELKLFELEKVFSHTSDEVEEHYELAGVMQSTSEIPYYEMQKIIQTFFHGLGVQKYFFETTTNAPSYSHPGRTAEIRLRGKTLGYIGEIHPKVADSFEQKKLAFFTLDAELLAEAMHQKIKAEPVSAFQENNFDLNFVVDKSTQAKTLQTAIEKTEQKLIKNVELVDIYENEEKIAGKRSFTYKITIQSMETTLDDAVKASLIEKIIKKVEKVGGSLR